MDEFPLKVLGRDAAPRQPSASSGDCFDCNICLDFAVDPVVTLCGHLYCWPCIYKWLQMEDRASSPSCPVCKAALSQDSLVPLYGRRTPSPAKRHHQAAAIPHRPPVRQHHHHHPQLLPSSLPTQMMSLAVVGLLEEMAVAVLPWAFQNPQTGAAVAEGLYHSRQYQPAGVGSRRRRRQEMQVERWLNQIWVFLFCCALLFLLLF